MCATPPPSSVTPCWCDLPWQLTFTLQELVDTTKQTFFIRGPVVKPFRTCHSRLHHTHKRNRWGPGSWTARVRLDPAGNCLVTCSGVHLTEHMLKLERPLKIIRAIFYFTDGKPGSREGSDLPRVTQHVWQQFKSICI